jgi:hypothetical protein
MQCHCVTEEMSRRFSVRRMHETGAGRIGVEMMTGASVGTGMTIAKTSKGKSTSTGRVGAEKQKGAVLGRCCWQP